jgi:hypothetical protein
LHREVIGLFITTKKTKGYSVQIEINGRTAYVNCDTEHMFFEEHVTKETLKELVVDKDKIIRFYKKSVREKLTQLNRKDD